MIFFIFIIAKNAHALCESSAGTYTTIFSKSSENANRIYFRAASYNIYLDTSQVLSYLSRASQKDYKQLAVEISKDLLLNTYLNIYKYSLRNQENTNFAENIGITDELIYEMLRNGYFSIVQMNRSGTMPLRIKMQENSGKVQFCSISYEDLPSELLYFHLNYVN